MDLLLKIANRIQECGGEIFYVGGYVRDKIIGKPNKDIDVEIYNITPDDLKSILAEFGEVQTIGKSFGIYNIKGLDIDFALPRTETATGRGHKDFEVFVDPFIDKKTACSRRDFTMNALMENVNTGEVLDFFGGREDINNKIIRHVSDETFSEDPLRVLRACQFSSRFGFEIAEETKELARKADLTALPSERIFEEIKKALTKSKKPSIFFNALKEMGYEYLFPELYRLDRIEQSADYHPEGNVYVHTMCVLDSLAELGYHDLKLMLSALCHDMGKYEAHTFDGKKHHFYNHESVGLPIAEAFLSRLTNETEIHKYVLDMVKNHMRIHQSLKSKKPKVWNRIFDESIAPSMLIELSFADTLNKDKYEHLKAIEWYTKYSNHCQDDKQLQGKDLVALGYKPSPRFTDILNFAHGLWLSMTPYDQIVKAVTKEFPID